MEAFKMDLDQCFKLKNMGEIKFFLGLQVARSSKGIFVSQHFYTLQLLEKAGQLGSKVVTTPIELNLRLSKHEGDLVDDLG